MRLYVLTLAAFVLFSKCAAAQVIETTNHTVWQNSVQSYTTLTFTDLPNFTIVTTQYSSLGITFTDGSDYTFATTSFADGHGLVSNDGFGNLGTIHMSFAQPMHWLGFDFVGGLQVALYFQGELLYTGGPHAADFGPFLGFVSAQPFDAAIA